MGYHRADIKTPNIDKLAAGGAKLEQFYTQPFCTPSRACLMTGRYPLRYGLQTIVIPASHTYGLPTDEWLLPQALKEAGCRTAIIGKWHLGHGDKTYWPRQRGFDHQYGPLIGEIDYFSHEAEHISAGAHDERVSEALIEDQLRRTGRRNRLPFRSIPNDCAWTLAETKLPSAVLSTAISVRIVRSMDAPP